jgi:hypothetical protein
MQHLSRNGNPLKAIGFRKAIDLMRLPGTRLIQQKTEVGAVHYVVPGGYVSPATAQKIKDHPRVLTGRDGLWPGHEQTWRMAD